MAFSFLSSLLMAILSLSITGTHAQTASCGVATYYFKTQSASADFNEKYLTIGDPYVVFADDTSTATVFSFDTDYVLIPKGNLYLQYAPNSLNYIIPNNYKGATNRLRCKIATPGSAMNCYGIDGQDIGFIFGALYSRLAFGSPSDVAGWALPIVTLVAVPLPVPVIPCPVSTTTTTTTSSTTSKTSTTTSISSSTTSSAASTSTSVTTSASSTPTAHMWIPIGCYTDSTNQRTLSNAVGVIGALTIESCLAVCEARGLPYAGVEYGSECYCDSKIGTDSTLTSTGDCAMTCNGNTSEICGGPSRLNVYQYTGTLTPSTVTLKWDVLGCYTDSSSNRALAAAVSVPDSIGVSIESCEEACYSNGYSYAGVEYGKECWCGNDISNTNPASDGCNMACAANAAEICGGGDRMNLFHLVGTSTPTITATATTTTLPSTTFITSTTTTQSTSTTTTTIPTSSSAQWVYVGCYVDNIDSRTLRKTAIINNGMTIEKCEAECKAGGFLFAGLENSGECYCDYSIQNGASLASGDAQCNMPCSANSAEICGGGNELSLYVRLPIQTYGWTSLGCYTDDMGARTLTKTASVDGAMTVEKCQAACFAGSYLLSGVEFGSECYCDNNINSGSSVLNGCTYTCNGDQTELCGGSNRLNLYSYSAIA